MKKFLILLTVLIPLLCSCSDYSNTKKIEIIIPDHQWEKDSSTSLWYTLKWTYKDEIKSLHLSSNQRKTTIEISRGESVFICAYPLDSLNPLGGMISPTEKINSLVLDPNEGVLASYLINQDRSIVRSINTVKLKAQAASCCQDFRDLDSITLLTDTLNGKLSEKSFVQIKKKTVGQLCIANGKWIAENRNDLSFSADEGLTPVLTLPVGTYRWYNPSLKMEFIINVDSLGQTSNTTRPASIG